MSIQYKTQAPWNANLIDLEYTDTQGPAKSFKGLVKYAVLIVTGAPDTHANVYLPGCQVVNAVDKTSYTMTGTSASPAWTLNDTGTTGITALTGDVIASGTGSVAATIAAKAVTGAKLITGTGYFASSTLTNGTTPVNVFGSTVPFSGTITGIYLVSDDTTAGNITSADTTGTIATIAKGTTAGAMVGATSLADTTDTLGNTITVVSSSAGNARVLITFTTA